MPHSTFEHRRTFLLASIALLGGCAHRPDSQQTEEYYETIDSMAITPTGDRLVAFGADHHYVFQPPRALTAALGSKLRDRLWAEFDDFELLPENEIRGTWRLLLPTNGLDPEAVALARSLGFTLTVSSGYLLQGAIRGMRYRANSARPADAVRTHRPYRIRVVSAGKYPKTPQHITNWTPEPSPVRVDTTGLLVLGAIVLLPLIPYLNPCLICR